MPTAQVIHHDAAEAQRLAAILSEAAYTVRIETDSLDGLLAIEQQLPALIVLDWHLPFIDGAIFLRALRAWAPDLPSIVALISEGDDRCSIRQAGACAALTTAEAPAVLPYLVARL
jgi:DNA-binding response OmpR family regulator